MSLDIRVKKKIPTNKAVPTQPVVKTPVKSPIENNKVNRQTSEQLKVGKPKSKNNIWWWILFIILFLLFAGVIYFIWQDNQMPSSIKTTKSNETPPGIVSNFATETVSPQDNTNDTQVTFDINLLTERVAEFEQKTDSLLIALSATSSTSTVNNTQFEKSFSDFLDSARVLSDFLSKQYEYLSTLAQANPNYNQTVDYLISIEDYLERVNREIKVLDALVALKENENFANEINIAVRNLNEYFKQIRNMTILVNQSLFDNLTDSTYASTTSTYNSTSTTSTATTTKKVD